jgi:tRNA-dihydrouridine synthase B
MAGFTDFAFRKVLAKCGSGKTWTEMISATALFYKSKKTEKMLRADGKTVVQLFGKKPEHFEYVCRSGLLDGFAEININMGCPAPKIVKNGEGCALMGNIELARKIIRVCVSATSKPVSVKMRLGMTRRENCEGESQAVAFAKMCESAGASRLVVHGRYGEQGYSGVADWSAIADVVKAVKIPVIANGDVRDMAGVREVLRVTGADGVMVGRALLGAPWKVRDMDSIVTENEIKQIITYHIEKARELHGEGGILEMRKHLLFYCNHLAGGKELKKEISVCASFDEARRLLGLE